MKETLLTLANLTKRLVAATNWSLLMGVSFFVLTLFITWQGVNALTDYLATEQNSKLSKVLVHGEPVYTTEKAIIAKIKSLKVKTFFD
ncbi:MAG: cell division protein, partial [Pseudoalteromonas spongiae]